VRAVRRYGGTALNGSSLASNLLRAAEHPRSGGARQSKSPAREGRVGVKPKDERAKVKSPAREGRVGVKPKDERAKVKSPAR
jgi:hypothetical protein